LRAGVIPLSSNADFAADLGRISGGRYRDSAGNPRPSSLNSGGPYAIGNYNLLVVVAENGDDSDYTDSIVEFSWYTPRGSPHPAAGTDLRDAPDSRSDEQPETQV